MQARVVITAPFSNSGKTILTLAIHQAFRMKGLRTVSFKVGPDYLDPQAHRDLLEIPAYNLDSFFLNQEQICSALAQAKGDLSIIEGVMGYYDGIGSGERASTYEVAHLSETPAIIVVDAKGMGMSVAAVLKGFQEYKHPSHIQGVLFNRVSAERYASLKEKAEALGLPSLGYFPEIPEARFPSQYMGLKIPGGQSLASRMLVLGEQALSSVDLDQLLSIAREAAPLSYGGQEPGAREAFKLALARDDAFSFLYRENLEWMEALGAEIIPFSPLRDDRIPPEADALYLPGGYPERFAGELAGNTKMLKSVREAVTDGLPCIAEGGGFLYLHERLEGEKLVGIVPAEAKYEGKRQGFGYHYLIPRKDSLIGIQGKKIPTRRYHYCSSSAEGEDYLFEKLSTGQRGKSGYAAENLYASFFTLYFPAMADETEHFVKRALLHKSRKSSPA